MKRYLLILVTLLTVCIAASAANPIRWRLSVKMTGETEGVITLKALVEPGWHLYGTSLPEGGPKPTQFFFNASHGIKLTGKVTPSATAGKHTDAMFGTELTWWDSNVQFTVPFKITDRNGAKVVATVKYMGCNDVTCLPPSSETLTYVFK